MLIRVVFMTFTHIKDLRLKVNTALMVKLKFSLKIYELVCFLYVILLFYNCFYDFSGCICTLQSIVFKEMAATQ